jgi:hypothetical protein
MYDSIKEFGGLASPADTRDFKPEDLLGEAAPTPSIYSTDVSMVPVYSQGQFTKSIFLSDSISSSEFDGMMSSRAYRWNRNATCRASTRCA